MYLLLLALVLTALKWAEINPVGQWSWWIVLGAYGSTALWWWWADVSGYTRRQAEERIEERRQKRIAQHKDGLGMRRRPPR